MKRLAGLLMLFVAAGLFLAPLPAQDKGEDKKDEKKAAAKKEDVKKDEVKEAKKDEAKKDEAKKDEAKKDEAKKDEKTAQKDKKDEPKVTSKREAKKVDPVEEKILKETEVLTARISQMEAGTGAGITVELKGAFPPKVLAAYTWYKQQLQIGGNRYEAQKQLYEKLSKARYVEVKTAENIKIRTLTPPIEYDIKGNLKRWTAKELAALKGASRLPGYPAEFDKVAAGQIVNLYVAKAPPAKRTPPTAKNAKKKMDLDDEDVINDYPRPEVLMIVVVIEAPSRN
jgi:hypothetical protein